MSPVPHNDVPGLDTNTSTANAKLPDSCGSQDDGLLQQPDQQQQQQDQQEVNGTSKTPYSNSVQYQDVSRRDSLVSNASSVAVSAATNNTSEANGRTVSKGAGATSSQEPPDGGWGWMIVLGCVLIGALVPSLFMCFGVFMNAFMEVFPNTSKSSAAWIPSIMSSLMNCMGPITSALVNKYSSRLVTLAGGIILSSGLVLSYFTNSIEALYFTYGVLGGIGAGLCIAPGLYLISQYFNKRRGVATGLCMAGSSLGQIATPYLVQFLLDEYDYRSCILILGGLILNICVAAALYRPLTPAVPKVSRKPRRPRTVSQCSNRSLTFLAEEGGIGVIKNGVYHKKKKQHSGGDQKKNKLTAKKNAGSAMSKNDVKAILLENFLINNKQGLPENITTPPRSRSRTLSIDSSRILPDIPEVPEEPEEHDERDERGGQGTQICKLDPSNGHTTECPKSEPEDGTATSRNGQETLLSQAPDCTTVTINTKDTDSVKDHFLSKPEKVPTTANRSQDLVSLHSCYGSVASIASLAPPLKDKYNRLSVLQNISTMLGLSNFKESLFYILALSFAFLIMVLSNFTMFVPTYGRSLGLSKDESAGLISIIAIASMFGRLILPAMSDYVKIHKKHIYSVSCLCTMAAIIVTASTSAYELLITSLVIFGFTSGGSTAISLGVFLDYIPLDKFTGFFGLAQLVVGILLLFSTPILGLLVDITKSFSTTFWILAALSGISGTIIYLDRFASYQTSTQKEKTSV